MGEPSVKSDESKSSGEVQEATEAPTTLRSEFYGAYKRQARIFDKELREYGKELNVTLLFSALLAVVTSTFLRLGEGGRLLLAWDDEHAASTITTIVFCCLAVSLIVAALAIFAKGSLRRYAILDFDAAADPSHGRYRTPSAFHRFAPRVLGLFIEGLSLVLQASLLVITCVLANYLWNHDRWAASLTVVGVEILCTILVISATAGPAFLVTKNIRKPLLRALVSTRPNVKNFRERTLPKRRPSGLGSDDGNLEKLEIVSNEDIPLIFEQQPIDWDQFVSDSLCITWMFDRSADSDEVTVILDFITEVVWHSGICEVPLAKVFEIFDRCFDHSKGTPTLIPRLRDRAYTAGRALVHLRVQWKCIGEENCDPLEGLGSIRGSYSSRSYDSDLDSILNIVDRLLGTPRPIDWTEFTFSKAHQCWLSHILLYRAWDHLCYTSKLPDDVEAFITHASAADTNPAVIADCLFIISLLVGISLHVDDLAVDDKSSQNKALYERIFGKLESTFTNHAIQEYARSLDVLRLTTPLQNDTVATKSYNLFRVILSSSFEEEELWTAARFALHGAYKWDRFLPWVEDPDDILKCLTHHLTIQAKGEVEIARQPIEHVMRAIAYASNKETLEGLKKFDFADKLFVDGIRRTFEEDCTFQTRKAALFFMPMIQHRWFDDSLEDVMSDEAKVEFCKNWGSAVAGIEHTTDVKKAICGTLFGMMNSKRWRSHIVKDKLRLMAYFPDLPEESKHFIACKKNASILPWLRSRADEAGADGEEMKLWRLWLGILWSDYADLPEGVRDQVLEATKVVTSKARHDVCFILRIMTTEKERYKAKLDEYEAASLEDEPERLRVRLEGLNVSIEKFTEVAGKEAK